MKQTTSGSVKDGQSVSYDEAPSMPEYDMLAKIILIGDTGVGKSSLLLRFADDEFMESYISTIGVDLRIRTVDVNETRVKLQIWDTAGQERFKTICQQYYRGSNAVVVCFDTTNYNSFQHVTNWMEEAAYHKRDDCLLMLVGTKCDATSKREVSENEARILAEKMGYVYAETSAKSGTNVEAVFMNLAKEMSQRFQPLRNSGQDSPIKLNLRPEKQKSMFNCFGCSIM